jgi:putative protease
MRLKPKEAIPVQEQQIGQVTHYWNGIHVAGVHLDHGTLEVGDTIHILGRTTDLEQTVGSIEIDHHKVQSASAGRDVGVKVTDRVREHDMVFKVIDEAESSAN